MTAAQAEATVKSGRFEMTAASFYETRVARVMKLAATDAVKAADLAISGAKKLIAAGWDVDVDMHRLNRIYNAIIIFSEQVTD